MADFAQNLITLRKARKLTQLELAHLLDIQPRMLGRWEQGVVKPQFDHMVQLAQVLEVSLDCLVYGTDSPQPTAFEINNKRLQELCKQVDQLPSDDQAVVCHFLDMAIRQDQFRRLAARPAA
ncbi:MAG: helix-turn-helix transcriptional regulator [Candidatus Competibacteraceae bacterium]|nr:helix-turn-helix transcriptional regulator [Candidatus Competibacteraceae bacterium]